MGHFYLNGQGNRGETTRMGTANSGIWAHVRGWNVGGFVEMYNDGKGDDVARVFVTNGSNGNRHQEVCEAVEGEEVPRIKLTDHPEIRAAAARLLGVDRGDCTRMNPEAANRFETARNLCEQWKRNVPMDSGDFIDAIVAILTD